MNRRSVLATVGGIATAAGLGGFAFSQTGAAANARIQSRGAKVSNDRGDVTEVSVDPSLEVSWRNFDDAAGKVFILIEAKVADGDYSPIYRATPWLGLPGDDDTTALGTSGTLDIGPFSDLLGDRLTVADADGRPAYEEADFSAYGPASLETFLNGVSMGSASEAGSFFDDQGITLQNNFPSANAGYYGAVASTKPYPASPFDESNDGTTSTTEVGLRYTFEFQRPNLSQLEYRLSQAPFRRYKPDGFSGYSDEEKREFFAQQFDGLLASDIDAGNSRIVMNGEDGYPSFETPSGIPYAGLRDAADAHPGIIVTETSFDVTTVNEQSETNPNPAGNSQSGTGAR